MRSFLLFLLDGTGYANNSVARISIVFLTLPPGDSKRVCGSAQRSMAPTGYKCTIMLGALFLYSSADYLLQYWSYHGML